jgi:hypothetical protein
MLMTQLSLAKSPSLGVPMRFLATAPLFGILAALLVLWAGPDGMGNRWMPATLAVTHLLVLGVMGSAMLGALLQVFPVVIGYPVHRGETVSRVTHGLMSLGIVLLAYGLLQGGDAVMLGAVAALMAAVSLYALAVARTFLSVATWGDTGRAVALALVALAITAGLGIWLALGHTALMPLARQWTDLHLAWGLIGWFPLLLVGVAYQVVPMFQVTPNYPRLVQRWLAPGLFGLLLVLSVLMIAGLHGGLRLAVELLLAAGLAAFAVITLDLQRRRRRRLKDVTVWYWRLAMGALLLTLALWLSARFVAGMSFDLRYPMALGVLLVVGTAISVINGMLYKIVPFLVWLHLTNHANEAMMQGKALAGPVPNMKQIIRDKSGKRQFYVHVAALVLALLGVLGVPLALQAAALAFAVANALLLRDIIGALQTYRRLAPTAADQGAASPSS